MIKPYAPISCASFFARASHPPLSASARRIGLVDKPGIRKRLQEPVPLAGGIAIFLDILRAAAFSLTVN